MAVRRRMQRLRQQILLNAVNPRDFEYRRRQYVSCYRSLRDIFFSRTLLKHNRVNPEIADRLVGEKQPYAA